VGGNETEPGFNVVLSCDKHIKSRKQIAYAKLLLIEDQILIIMTIITNQRLQTKS
jgi:hypothetical protein